MKCHWERLFGIKLLSAFAVGGNKELCYVIFMFSDDRHHSFNDKKVIKLFV